MKILLEKGAIAPEYKTDGSVGADLYAWKFFDEHWNQMTHSESDFFIHPGELMIVSTGVAFEIPHCQRGIITARSSISNQMILTLPGNIDSDYRGIVSVSLFNFGRQSRVFRVGDRVAQIVFHEVRRNPRFRVCTRLSATGRGSGGFGSTGR